MRVTRGHGLLEEFLAKERSNLAHRLIPLSYADGSILDIGCGTFPFFLLNAGYSKKYGLDKVVRKGYDRRFQNSGITFINHDIEGLDAIPFDGGFFDVVTMLAVIEHVEPAKIRKVFEEIRRILRPGGICVITTPAVSARPLLRLMAKTGLVSSIEIKEHKYAYSRNKIVSALEEASFTKRNIRTGYFVINMWAMAVK